VGAAPAAGGLPRQTDGRVAPPPQQGVASPPRRPRAARRRCPSSGARPGARAGPRSPYVGPAGAGRQSRAARAGAWSSDFRRKGRESMARRAGAPRAAESASAPGVPALSTCSGSGMRSAALSRRARTCDVAERYIIAPPPKRPARPHETQAHGPKRRHGARILGPSLPCALRGQALTSWRSRPAGAVPDAAGPAPAQDRLAWPTVSSHSATPSRRSPTGLPDARLRCSSKRTSLRRSRTPLGGAA